MKVILQYWLKEIRKLIGKAAYTDHKWFINGRMAGGKDKNRSHAFWHSQWSTCPQIALMEATAQIFPYFKKLRFQRRWAFPYNSSPGPREGQAIVLWVACPATDFGHRTADRSQRNKGHDTQVTSFIPCLLDHSSGDTEEANLQRAAPKQTTSHCAPPQRTPESDCFHPPDQGFWEDSYTIHTTQF